jgi:hypothetical protein
VGRKRFGLGAAHVGLEPAEPEQAGRIARSLTHRDPARRRTSSYFEKQGFAVHVDTHELRCTEAPRNRLAAAARRV